MPDRMTALAQLPRGPVDLFLRDDDAGWDDARLLALLDVAQAAGVPIDLAAIPTAVTPALARELAARIATTPERVAVHQHGFAHLDHDAPARKCEFGAARDAAAQRADLVQGRARLVEHFGSRLQPWFTPPWNRLSAHTPRLLAELGYRALSRDRRAQPLQHALPELAVDVDWSRQWRIGGADALAVDLARALRERANDHRPLGLMLHHAAMSAEELHALRALLAATADHPHWRWRSMRALLDTDPTTKTDRCATTA